MKLTIDKMSSFASFMYDALKNIQNQFPQGTVKTATDFSNIQKRLVSMNTSLNMMDFPQVNINVVSGEAGTYSFEIESITDVNAVLVKTVTPFYKWEYKEIFISEVMKKVEKEAEITLSLAGISEPVMDVPDNVKNIMQEVQEKDNDETKSSTKEPETVEPIQPVQTEETEESEGEADTSTTDKNTEPMDGDLPPSQNENPTADDIE